MALRVIIADDHPIVLLAVQALLERDGQCEVVAKASTTDELVEKMSNHHCDVLVTDFSMPGTRTVGGLRFLGQLRRRFPRQAIVIFTMLSSPAVLAAIVDCGVMAICDKGASMEDLPIAVAHASTGQRFESRTITDSLDEIRAHPETASRKKLSPSELEIVRLFTGGLSLSDIGSRLGRSPKTASRQKRAAMEKLEIATDGALYDYARRHGIIS
jgi:two-component system, NarL family, captular synthesis response regulator RcsB